MYITYDDVIRSNVVGFENKIKTIGGNKKLTLPIHIVRYNTYDDLYDKISLYAKNWYMGVSNPTNGVNDVTFLLDHSKSFANPYDCINYIYRQIKLPIRHMRPIDNTLLFRPEKLKRIYNIDQVTFIRNINIENNNIILTENNGTTYIPFESKLFICDLRNIGYIEKSTADGLRSLKIQFNKTNAIKYLDDYN